MKKNRELKNQYKNIFEEVTKIINYWDPIGLIGMGCPLDEYDIEINYFLPKILDDYENTNNNYINESFVKYFGDTYKMPETEVLKINQKIKELIERILLTTASSG